VNVERKVAISAPQSRSAGGSAIDFEAVRKTYGLHIALHPINLSVGTGEFFSVIGPSGSGKSTLLGIAAGFVAPDAGAVRVDGHDVVMLPPYRRNFGMVFQGYALFPHMTVAENIAFPLRMRGCPKAEIAMRVRQALEMVRLAGFGDRRPSQLSGGQQQRVALARAAVYGPALLLMDEPLGALDKNLREEMQEEIKRLRSALGATVIYVTHDQHEAAFMSDRLAIMRDGALVQVGTPRAVYEAPANEFVASFLGEASILPVVTVAPTPDGLALRSADGLEMRIAAQSVPPGKVGLCLRPENVAVGDDALGRVNSFTGTVVESVFTTGSVRYRIRLDDAAVVVTARLSSHPGIALMPVGTRTRLGWHAASAALVAL
jgi:putative spermidine/putrescine transport system ATP-binding protein